MLNSLLIFNFFGVSFALDATQVLEVVWLPELTAIEESPSHIVGIFSQRGQIVPVIDLNLRFGHPPQPYQTTNQVVVLEFEENFIGLIVSEVCEVIYIDSQIIRSIPEFDKSSEKHAHFVTGEIRVNDDLVMLLDVSQLTFSPSHFEPTSSVSHSFFQQTSANEAAIYHARAIALMESVVEDDAAHLSLFVIELGGEHFAIELQSVQEFCDITVPREIPCCPPHILGVISLRGNLLTLLDISSILNLPPAKNSTKAIITHLKEQLVAVAVDKLNDVLYLREDALQSTSASNEQHKIEIKGTVPYAGKMIAVLDLPALLARHEWVVDENV